MLYEQAVKNLEKFYELEVKAHLDTHFFFVFCLTDTLIMWFYPILKKKKDDSSQEVKSQEETEITNEKLAKSWRLDLPR